MTCVMAVFLLVLSLCCWFKSESEYSNSERRVLDSFPQVTLDSVLSGKFMMEFEEYTLDQFPLRDKFRMLKAVSSLYVFQKMDNNDLYISDGYIAKLEYPLNEVMADHAADRFEYIYNTYLSENNKVYFSVVPDKNYYLAQSSGHLFLDYDTLINYMRERMSFAKYIDITQELSPGDYYKTDTHWRQENILDVVEKLSGEMEFAVADNYKENTLAVPFFGVYSGQFALPVKPEEIKFLTNDTIDSCIVTSYDTGKPVKKHMYDMDKAYGKDPYEMFTSGSDALITIENPNAHTEKELILFRDSFASSLAPLLVEGYSKITMVDIRYIQSQMLGSLIEFENQDVLFLYSTLLLNNSLSMK